MRISDWSSDVCSSDLLFGAGNRHQILLDQERAQFGKLAPRLGDGAVGRLVGVHLLHAVGDGRPRGIGRAGGLERVLIALEVGLADAPQFVEQIGRASCRERGWQYVSISVVAVALQKKNN